MCKKKQFKYCPFEIDKCMYKVLMLLNLFGIKTLACCCGHKKHHMTIVFERGVFNTEVFSGVTLDRKKKFYRRDVQGYYYIPEVEDYWKRNNL